MPRHKLMKVAEVLSYTQMSRSTLYVQVREGKFPSPIRTGPRAVAWLEKDVDKWVEQCIHARNQGH